MKKFDPFASSEVSRIIFRGLRQTLWKLDLYPNNYLILKTLTHQYCLKYRVDNEE